MKFSNLYLLFCLFLVLSCQQDDPGFEQITEPLEMEHVIEFSINNEDQEPITFDCNNAPALYGSEIRQDVSNDNYLFSQGFLSIPLSNSREIKYTFIIYGEDDIKNLEAMELKSFIENNPESIYFDIEFIQNGINYRNQFFTPEEFGNRNVVANDEEFNFVISEPSTSDCTDNSQVLFTSIDYTGTISTEDQSQQIELAVKLQAHLRTW